MKAGILPKYTVYTHSTSWNKDSIEEYAQASKVVPRPETG
jgi:hypothetical protein